MSMATQQYLQRHHLLASNGSKPPHNTLYKEATHTQDSPDNILNIKRLKQLPKLIWTYIDLHVLSLFWCFHWNNCHIKNIVIKSIYITLYIQVCPLISLFFCCHSRYIVRPLLCWGWERPGNSETLQTEKHEWLDLCTCSTACNYIYLEHLLLQLKQ